MAKPMTEDLPAVARRWNWGAFLMGPVWGVANRTYLPLISLIPVVSFVWMFVCGRYGSEWAWRSNHYGAGDEVVFQAVQDSWRRGAFFLTVLNALYLLISTIGLVMLIGIVVTAIQSQMFGNLGQ